MTFSLELNPKDQVLTDSIESKPFKAVNDNRIESIRENQLFNLVIKNSALQRKIIDNRPETIMQKNLLAKARNNFSANRFLGIEESNSKKEPIQAKFSVQMGWLNFSETVKQPKNWMEAFSNETIIDYEKRILLSADKAFGGLLKKIMDMDSIHVRLVIERGVHSDTRKPQKGASFEPEPNPHQTIRIYSMDKSFGYHIIYQYSADDWVFSSVMPQSNVSPEQLSNFIPSTPPPTSKVIKLDSSSDEENTQQEGDDSSMIIEKSANEGKQQPKSQKESTQEGLVKEVNCINFYSDLGAITSNKILTIWAKTSYKILPDDKWCAIYNQVRVQILSTDSDNEDFINYVSSKPIVYLKRKWIK